MELRVWWIPQVPGHPMYVPVNSLEEARLILDTLALYDKFQVEQNVKPDYSNAGGLEYFDEETKEWSDWYDETGCYDFDEYCTEKNINRYIQIEEANS